MFTISFVTENFYSSNDKITSTRKKNKSLLKDLEVGWGETFQKRNLLDIKHS